MRRTEDGLYGPYEVVGGMRLVNKKCMRIPEVLLALIVKFEDRYISVARLPNLIPHATLFRRGKRITDHH